MVISCRWSSYMRNTQNDLASCYLLSNSNTVFTIEIAPPTTAKFPGSRQDGYFADVQSGLIPRTFIAMARNLLAEVMYRVLKSLPPKQQFDA